MMAPKIGLYFELSVLLLLSGCNSPEVSENVQLRGGFLHPTLEARSWALWEWVDGNFQLEEISLQLDARGAIFIVFTSDKTR